MNTAEEIREVARQAALRLIGIAPEELFKSFVPILADCCAAASVDGACLFHFSEDRTAFIVSQFWNFHREAANHLPKKILVRDVPSLGEMLRNGQPYELSSSVFSARPFQEEEEVFKRAGVAAFLAVPVMKDGGVIAGLALARCRTAGRWSEDAWIALDEFGLLFSRLLDRIHPVTKRIQELRALVGGDTETIFHAVIDSLNQGVSCCCTDGLIVYCNPSWERITGYTLEETRGRRMYEFLFPADAGSFERLKERQHERYEERRKGFAEEYETQIIRKDGKKRWIQIKASPLRNQELEVVGSISILTDITEQKMLQENPIRVNEPR